MTSIKMNTPCELINITPLNPLISKCQIKVCYVGDEPNRNRSIITKEAARKIANSLPGSPIAGYYNEQTKDFEEHNKELAFDEDGLYLKKATRPYGFVDLNAKVWFQKYLENNIEREYLVTEGYIWTGQYPEARRIIEKGNKHSMELDNDEKNIDAFWAKDENGNKQFFIINEAIISELCILGMDYEPCFEGSDIKAPVEFSLNEENFKEQLLYMMNEVTKFLKEGGTNVNEDTKVLDTEFAKEEDKKEEEKVCPKCGKPLDECTCEKDDDKEKKEFAKEEEEKEEDKKCPDCGKPASECTCKDDEDEDKKKYSLDEIEEYVELNTKFSELQTKYDALEEESRTSYATLEESYNTLKAEYDKLVSFKNDVEKEKKQEMIDSFTMLSDADKKDVVDNINTYSIEDIEAKLSVICVRNRVSFDALEEKAKEETSSTTFSLDDTSLDDDVPAWVKAVRNVQNKM